MDIEVESDTDSVNTFAAVIFTPTRSVKKDIKRPVPINPPGAKKNQPGISDLKGRIGENTKEYENFWFGKVKVATLLYNRTETLSIAFYYPLGVVRKYFSVY